MELALQATAVALGPQKPGPADVDPKYILSIKNGDNQDTDYPPRQTYVFSLPLADAITRLERDSISPDAVLISPECISGDIERLTGLIRKKAIPLILHTREYDKSVKSLAFDISADDYYYGTITDAFVKRLEFVKKVKTYKTGRGDKPYSNHAAGDISQAKLWSMKRAFDLLVSSFALTMLSPLCLLIALIIKLESKGPVLYVSKRAGTGYKIFDFYKFRTMRSGADAELAQLAHLNQYGDNSSQGVFFKIKNDPRITRFGQFLRNTSLDELPQLLNVLIGDMSLVGNRPLPLYEAEKLTRDQIAWRFLAPAGITGLWQITKRGKDNMSPEERIAMDIEYAMKNSFWFDMKILFSTFPALLQKETV